MTAAVRCGNCPNPANCSPTFCHFADADEMTPETPHDKAARHFWEPGASLHIEAYSKRLYIRAWDGLFNLPHRITLWWDGLNELDVVNVAIVLVVVCAVVGVAAVG